MSARSNGQDHELELSGEAVAAEDDAAETALAPSLAQPVPAGEAAPEDEIAALRGELAELNQDLLRRRADFENYRKRVERDRAAAGVEAEASVLRQVLGTLDNLERALGARDTGAALREGVVLTHRELLSLLESLGVETLDPIGQRFDPVEHQAILHEPAEGFEPGTIAEVFRKGFRYRERLLRPALVKVASGEVKAGTGTQTSE